MVQSKFACLPESAQAERTQCHSWSVASVNVHSLVMSPLASNAHQALLMSLVLAVLALWCASAQASPVQSGNSPVEEQLSSISPADSLPSTDQADLTRNSNLFDKAMLQRSRYVLSLGYPTCLELQLILFVCYFSPCIATAGPSKCRVMSC